jgi:hypothetical protein
MPLPRPAQAAVLAIAAGGGLFGLALGGVGAVGHDIAAADARRQQDTVLVRDVADRCPADAGRHRHHVRDSRPEL